MIKLKNSNPIYEKHLEIANNPSKKQPKQKHLKVSGPNVSVNTKAAGSVGVVMWSYG
jgi:hypothetical protein